MSPATRSGRPSVAIIVLNWNALAWTRSCLDLLASVTGVGHEVFVVDNASENGEADILEKEYGSRITLIRNKKNLGFAEGNNVALRHSHASKHDYFLLLNSDTEFAPEFVKGLVEAAEANPRAGVIGPLVRDWDGVTVQTAGAKRINLLTGSASMDTDAADDMEEYREVAMLSGCCFMITRAALEKVGMLDPDYIAYYEETDYCLRATRAGFKNIVVRDVEIRHYNGGSSTATSTFHERLLMRNRFMFVAKNGNVFQRASVIAYVTCFYLWARTALMLAKRQPRQVAAVWQGYLAGLRLITRP